MFKVCKSWFSIAFYDQLILSYTTQGINRIEQNLIDFLSLLNVSWFDASNLGGMMGFLGKMSYLSVPSGMSLIFVINYMNEMDY